MDLKAKIKVSKFLLSSLEDSIVSSMKSAESYAESHDMPDGSDLLCDYNTLGFILASVRDILKELDGNE